MKKNLRPTNLSPLEKKAKLLGNNDPLNLHQFQNMRLILAGVILIGSLIFLKFGYLFGTLLALAFYHGSEYFYLDYKINQRKLKIEREAIAFFEMFILSFESYRNVLSSLKVTTSHIDGDLSQEFKKVLAEIHLGKTMSACLMDMQERIPSETVKIMITNLLQISKSGQNASLALKDQISFLYQKQILEVKRKMTHLPIKIGIITLTLLLPILFLIFFSPEMIQSWIS